MPISVDTQVFLRLAEKAKTLVFFDIESTGLRGDYNSVLVVSVKPYKEKPESFRVEQPGNDKRVVREAKERLEDADAWVGYYSKMFDIPMLNTRLLKWGYKPIGKRPHLDMYFTLRANLLTARRSQSHLLAWLNTPEQKMTVGADVWNEILHNFNPAMKTMVQRCESDCAGLEGLYEKTKHVVGEIKK